LLSKTAWWSFNTVFGFQFSVVGSKNQNIRGLLAGFVENAWESGIRPTRRQMMVCIPIRHVDVLSDGLSFLSQPPNRTLHEHL
jgi:hypothetical protein